MAIVKPEARRAATTASGPNGPGDGADAPPRRPWWPPSRGLLAMAIATALVVAGAAAFVATRSNSGTLTGIRPSGVPANISTPVANLMGLGPVLSKPAPGFTLTDQNGHVHSLASFRGHPVVLEFMDPHCTDICPIVSQEFVDAYHDLGPAAKKVAFVAINVNKYHGKVADVATFSREHQLDTIPTWHFFTGPLPTLQKLWTGYDIAVTAPGPTADVVHTSIVYFIGPDGNERYIANPQDYHHKTGKAFLPANEITSWGQGIATMARDLGA